MQSLDAFAWHTLRASEPFNPAITVNLDPRYNAEALQAGHAKSALTGEKLSKLTGAFVGNFARIGPEGIARIHEMEAAVIA